VLFGSPDRFRTYWLPCHFEEQVIVTSHFYLKPLLPFLAGDGRFYLLALSQNDIRLLEGTHYSISEVALPEAVPHSQASAMQYDESTNELRYPSSSSGASVGKGGRRATIFHGQGVGTDNEKMRILRYFQQIDRGLQALLRDETAPLLLAGVAYLFPIYREANTYPHLSNMLVADHVYKLKKPKDFGLFDDYSTPALHRYFCGQEVRLNRCFAPHMYLGVAPVVEHSDGQFRFGPTFLHLHFDLLRPGLLRFGDMQFRDATFEGGLNLLTLDLRGERTRFSPKIEHSQDHTITCCYDGMIKRSQCQG